MKSYISVEVMTPKGFYEWTDSEQEEWWDNVHRAQQKAEEAYKQAFINAAPDARAEFDIESK